MKTGSFLYAAAALLVASLLIGCDMGDVSEPEIPEVDNPIERDDAPPDVGQPGDFREPADVGQPDDLREPADVGQPDDLREPADIRQPGAEGVPSTEPPEGAPASRPRAEKGGDDVGGKDVVEEPAEKLPKQPQ